MATQKQSPMGLVEDKLGVQCKRARRMGTRGAWVCTTGGWLGDRREGEKSTDLHTLLMGGILGGLQARN